MEEKNHLQIRFEESGKEFLESWKAMDDFDQRVGDREPTTVETVEAVYRFGDMLVKGLIALRDGDNWLKGH